MDSHLLERLQREEAERLRLEHEAARLRAFAEEYVTTGNAETAARRAKWIDPRYALRVHARRLLDRADVQTEILIAKASGITPRHPVGEHSREAIVDDLDEIREGAVLDGAWSAATGAVTTKARVLGYMEATVNLRVTSARELSLEDLERMVAALPQYAEFTEVDPEQP